jgi:hypothetical protein
LYHFAVAVLLAAGLFPAAARLQAGTGSPDGPPTTGVILRGIDQILQRRGPFVATIEKDTDVAIRRGGLPEMDAEPHRMSGGRDSVLGAAHDPAERPSRLID